MNSTDKAVPSGGVSEETVAAFEKKAADAGYDVTRKTLAPLEGTTSDHEHDFDVWGLVLDGDFRIFLGGEPKSHLTGEEFTLEAGCAHYESAGPEGAEVVIGKRPQRT